MSKAGHDDGIEQRTELVDETPIGNDRAGDLGLETIHTGSECRDHTEADRLSHQPLSHGPFCLTDFVILLCGLLSTQLREYGSYMRLVLVFESLYRLF